MNSIKMLWSAVLAVFAVLAFIGTAAALAVDQEVVVCNENLLLCGEEHIYQKGQLFSTAASGVAILTPFITVTCESSGIHGKTTASMGKSLPIEYTQHSFFGCEPCGVVGGKASGGSVSMDEPGEKYLLDTTLEIKMSECAFGTKCTFVGKGLSLDIKNKETGTPEIIAEKEELVLTEGLSSSCGSVAKFDAVYIFTEPKKAYFSLFELKS
jgi:hypothetical protein